MIVKNFKKSSVLINVLLFIFVTYFVMRVCTLMNDNQGKITLEILDMALNNLYKIWLPFNLTKENILASVGCGIFSVMLLETYYLTDKKNMQNEAMGSAQWSDGKEFKKIQDKNFYNNYILTSQAIISRNMAVSKLSRNIIMIGAPGRGKSRYVFKPNLLNSNGNTIICTDPKGELLRDCGNALKEQGYDIKVLNIDEKWKSNHYNPLNYIKKLPIDAIDVKTIERARMEGKDDEKLDEDTFNERINHVIQEDDVMSLVNTLFANTKGDIDTTQGDPFWEHLANLYVQALIYIALWYKKVFGQACNFQIILYYISKTKLDEDGNITEIDNLVNKIREEEPDYIGINQWDLFKKSATTPKTLTTVTLEAVARLNSFNVKEVKNLTSDDDMELNRIGKGGDEGKIAYFIITNPNDNTFNYLANMFYSQIFNIIDKNAKENDGSLAVPTDLYMDEWYQLGEIPRFLEILAYIRGLNCGVLIGVQSVGQLEGRYKDNWETVFDCCDHILYLGSKSKKTLDYMSAIMGKQTLYKYTTGKTRSKQNSNSKNWDIYGRELATIDELGRMKKGYAILLSGEYLPLYSKLYDLNKHPRYDLIFEPWDKGNPVNDAKRYNHQQEMLKTAEEIYYEKQIAEYCKNNGYDKENFYLPFSTKNSTVLVTDEDLKYYRTASGFKSNLD